MRYEQDMTPLAEIFRDELERLGFGKKVSDCFSKLTRLTSSTWGISSKHPLAELLPLPRIDDLRTGYELRFSAPDRTTLPSNAVLSVCFLDGPSIVVETNDSQLMSFPPNATAVISRRGDRFGLITSEERSPGVAWFDVTEHNGQNLTILTVK